VDTEITSPRRARWRNVATALLALVPASAGGTQRFGPIELAGNLQTQNLVRHPDAATYQFIQNRNTLHLQLDYDWLRGGKFYNKYDLPFVESSHLLLKYRGAYDSIYDTTPGILEKEDIHGKAYGNRTVFQAAQQLGLANQLKLSSLSHGERDALKFDNQLREAYADVKLRTLPLTVRAGRQQIVWGESDNFRMLDRANSLDATWHLVQEVPPPAFGWDEIRRPFWMLKFLYDLGNLGPLTQSFLEWYWNPGDWQPVKVAFLPRPWGVRTLNPLTNPIDGGFTSAICASSPILVRLPNGTLVRGCDRLLKGTTLFGQGDWHRNPMENSQVGVRYHGITPPGVEFTLVYFYQRWSGDDGTDYAPVRGVPKTFNPAVDRARFARLIAHGTFPAEFIAPYVHSIGFSANYADETYTQTVYRLETLYDVGVPFFDLAKVTLIDTPSLPGVRKKNMWKGMLGFDRPTWIRPLNPRSTFFVTGQFFWHYLVNNPSCRPQINAQLAPTDANGGPGPRVKAGSCLVGGFDLPSTLRPQQVAYRDKIRDWETLATLGATSFYRGGSIMPIFGFAVDLANHFVMEPFWAVDFVVREDVVLNLAQRYFVNPSGKSPIFDTWGFSSMSRGRSETSVRLTYQF
jgi:hypothetical protein